MAELTAEMALWGSGQSLLVLGGARSGKSRHAQARMEALPGRLAYIATAQVLDSEMADRIAQHRRDRDDRWQTIEQPLELAEAIGQAETMADAILVDCLTLWLSNLMLADQDTVAAGETLVQAIARCRRPLVLVSNEVGLGIVPDNALARRFRDEAGKLNQMIAACVDEVVFVAAGLPLRMK